MHAKGKHWRHGYFQQLTLCQPPTPSYESFPSYRTSDWHHMGYKFNNPHSQHFQRCCGCFLVGFSLAGWGFFVVQNITRHRTHLGAEYVRVGNSNWKYCTVFCVCICGNNRKEMGWAVYRDTTCKTNVQGRTSQAAPGLVVVEFLSKKDVNSHCTSDWKKDSLDNTEQICPYFCWKHQTWSLFSFVFSFLSHMK